jgi:hypothetical protein
MARLDSVPGISAEVCSNGEALTEYPDSDDITVNHAVPEVVQHQVRRTVSNYIIAEDKNPFSIKVRIQNGSEKVGFQATMYHERCSIEIQNLTMSFSYFFEKIDN